MFPSEDPSALNPQQRRSDLAAMSETTLDVLVIGGGVTGAGVALDAATRGLSVGLIEQRDYASGTSSRSSKMFHGGLRYLEHYNFGLVREALRERNLMLNRLCPHLVEPTSFIYPLAGSWWERLYVGAGVFLYEVLARMASNPLPWHSHLGKSQIRELAPALDASGGVRYWDAVVDDARHTMTLARTAARHGALIANSARLTEFEIEGDRIRAAVVNDLESGKTLRVAARSFVNATGVWTDDIERLAHEHGINVRSSKGIHILVPRDRINSSTGILLRTEVSVLFVIPWGAHWIIGTTDTPWSLGRAHPAASRSDIEYLLKWVNSALTTTLSARDIVGVYAGLRPLLQGESEDTSKLSREHAVFDRGNGLISVAGGKYTTYRVMAADAVGAVAPYLPGPLPPSRTETIPLVGATGRENDRLVGRYGTNKADIDALVASSPDMAGQVVDEAPYLRAEVAYAATHEGALHLDDLLTRRTRLSIETADRGIDAVQPVVDTVAPILGWDQNAIRREVEHYRARVAAERDSQTRPDDETADAARMGAPDVRIGGLN